MKHNARYAGAALVGLVVIAGWLVGTAEMQTRKTMTTEEDFMRATKELSNWGRWGKDDELGAANFITPAKRKQAAALVKEGIAVSMAHDIFQEIGHIRVPAGAPFRGLPRSLGGTVFPAARVQENHVTFGDLDVLHLLERLQVFAMDRRARLQPTLRGLPWKQRGIEEDAAGDHAVLEGNDASLGTAVSRLNFFERPAVVPLAVLHLVTVHRVQMAVDRAVVGSNERVLVRRPARAGADHLPL